MQEKQPGGGRRELLFAAVVFIVLGLIIYFLLNMRGGEEMTYADVRRYFMAEQVESFELKDHTLMLYLKEATESGATRVTYELADLQVFHDDLGDLITAQLKSGALLQYDYPVGVRNTWWWQLAPYFTVFLLFVLFWVMIIRGRSAGGGAERTTSKFGKAQTRGLPKSKKPVTFADVAGADEEKAELEEIVLFLKNPKKFLALGARIPKGILLVGPPGTGKTLLARAVAGEAGVEFLSISGSDFVELYVGVGASRVRDLFAQAKVESPTIVFIDEIDAVGRRRGAGLGGGHDEREQTLNQLLVEMDGFAANEGVVILAATNRPDILDPALLRPGRFDRQVYVGLPDIKGREEIMKIHARNKPMAEDVDLNEVAKGTSGFTGADLENLLNEGALLAAREGARFLNRAHLQEALIKVIAGPEKKSRVITEHARRLTAYHEAGHAIVISQLETPDPVHQISIVPRGQSGGRTISLPKEDKTYASRREMEEEIAVCLGGRVAEQLVLGDSSTGASSDLQRATRIARNMVTRFGMSDVLGTLVFETDSEEVFIGRSMNTRTYSEEVAGKIDAEMRAIVDTAYHRCEEVLTRRRALLDRVAAHLLEHETMDGETFRKLCGEDG